MNIANSEDAHDQTSSSAPSFWADSKHLVSGTSGWNTGGTPNSFGIPMCRANGCDADSHARPDSTSYDIGAYEGSGAQGTDSTCANLAPAACISGGSLMSSTPASLRFAPVSGCRDREIDIPIDLVSAAGEFGGLQFDLIYDSRSMEVSNPKVACQLDVPRYRGKVYTNSLQPAGTKGRLRVVVLDIDQGDTFGGGPLVTCRFSLNSGADVALSVEGLRIATAQGTLVDSSPASAVVRIDRGCPADDKGIR